MSNPLSNLPVPTLKILAKLAADAVKARRDELGQTKGEFEVDQTVVIRATGTVKVAKSTPDAVIAQKAEPWKLLVAAMELANQQLFAAGAVGIDLKKVVEAAETADPELEKETKKKVKEQLAEIKDEVRDFKWGGVSTPEAAVTVLAKEDHRPEEPAAPEIAVPF